MGSENRVSIKIPKWSKVYIIISSHIIFHFQTPTREDGRTIPYKGDAAQVEKKSNSSSAPATAKKGLAFQSCNGRLSKLGPIKLTATMDIYMSMYVWSERTGIIGISDSAFRVASLVTNQLLLRELCKHCCSLLLGYGVARKQQGFQKQPTDSVVLATDGSKCLDWAQLSTRTYQHPSKTCHM